MQRSERGASAIEYGLMVAALVAGSVLLLSGLTSALKVNYTDQCKQLSAVNASPSNMNCAVNNP